MAQRIELIPVGVTRTYISGSSLTDGSNITVYPNAKLVLGVRARWVIEGGGRVEMFAIRGEIENHGCIVTNGMLVVGLRYGTFHNLGEVKAVGSSATAYFYGANQYSAPGLVQNDGQITANAGVVHLERVTGTGGITVVAHGRVDIDAAVDAGATIRLHSGMLEFGKGAGMQFAGTIRGLSRDSQIGVDSAWDGRDLSVLVRSVQPGMGELTVARGDETILRAVLVGDYRTEQFQATHYGTDVVVTYGRALVGAPDHAEVV